MIIIQTKLIPRINQTLVVKYDKCVIQEVRDELGLLDEYLIPIVYNDNSFTQEVRVELDEILLGLIEKNEYMCVYATRVEFGLIKYNFNSNTVDHFETRLPKCAFVCILPDFKFDCDVTLFNTSCIMLDNGVTYELDLLHKSNHVVYDTRINGRFLEPGLCKVYREENFPVCLEYIKDGYIKQQTVSIWRPRSTKKNSRIYRETSKCLNFQIIKLSKPTISHSST